MTLSAERKTSWVRSSLSCQSWTMPSMRWKTSLPYALMSCSTASAAERVSTRASLSERYPDRYRSLRFRCMNTTTVTDKERARMNGEIRRKGGACRCSCASSCLVLMALPRSLPEIAQHSYPFIHQVVHQNTDNGSRWWKTCAKLAREHESVGCRGDPQP